MKPVVPVPVRTIERGLDQSHLDVLAVEEPLEIRINGMAVSITMRTPGNDAQLAAGYLFAEGVLRSPADIAGIWEPARNTVELVLCPDADVDFERLNRRFNITSACGVCGKASLEALEMAGCPVLPQESPMIDAEILHGLPETLREVQSLFEQTGGLHASALFDFEGRLHSVREDVGRHNALDKLVGAEFLAERTPLSDRMLLVSGRASYDVIQKALMAGIPAVVAVGAPSSMAVELARRCRMTLVGFLRRHRFNVYSGASRIRLKPSVEPAEPIM